jgi:hypothetical protein
VDHLRIPFSAVALALANLVPLLGVVFAGWSLLEVVALYWLENLIIGAINVLQMATVAPAPEYVSSHVQDDERARSGPVKPPDPHSAIPGAAHHLAKLFLIPFFVVHYGMFCLVHGVFVFVLLGGEQQIDFGAGPFAGLHERVGTMLSGWLWIAIVGLIASHLYSYFYHFLYRGEFRRTNVAMLMMAPYGRIVVLHVAILFGAFAAQLLGQPMFLLLLLIIGKTILDWRLHQRQHLALT